MKNPIIALRLTIILFITLLIPFINSNPASAQTSPEVTIYLFWGDGCPHCAVAKPFLEQLAASNPNIHLMKYEVYNDENNLALLKKVSQGFGFAATKVPTIFIGDQYWEGYTDAIESDIQKEVENGLVNGNTDKVASILAGNEQSTPEKSKIAPFAIAAGGVVVLVVIAAFLRRKKLMKSKK
jgi:glutaredoxin